MASTRLKSHAEALLAQETAPLLSLVAGIDQFLSRQRYARHSQRLGLVEASILACRVKLQDYWAIFAREAQRQALVTALDFATSRIFSCRTIA